MQKFFPAPHDYEVVHRNLYVTHQRVAATFRKGRVVLAGDSAHVNNPIGGMGLNGGLQDGANLSDKLARILLDGAPDRLLDIYDRQRRTVAVEFVQEQSIANKKRLEASDPEVRKRTSTICARWRPIRSARGNSCCASSMIASQRRADCARTGGRMTVLAPEQTSRPTLRPFLAATKQFAAGTSDAAGFPRSLPGRIRQPREGSRRLRHASTSKAPAPRPTRRPRAGRPASRLRRSTACRWASRTSSRPSTCRPRWARRCSPAGARRRTPPASRRCGRPARSSSARP